MVQTILGSGGGIGIPLARELAKYTEEIRLVSRNPVKVNSKDQLFQANLSDPRQVEKAIAGSAVVYVTVGYEYRLKVWQETWPPFMKAVIDACKRNNSQLLFFDNIYLYDKDEVPFMTEQSKMNPPSKKGLVRQEIHEMIMKEVEKGKLIALIARSADFYGPGNKNSALSLMVTENLLKGKKAQAFGDIDKIHTYTFTPDAAKATALLGNTADAYNQVWHVPTTKELLTNRQWIELIAKELQVRASVQVVPGIIIKLLGIFIPLMREFPEMMYQFKQDYIFDSTKFEKRFGFGATKPEEGVREMIKSLKE